MSEIESRKYGWIFPSVVVLALLAALMWFEREAMTPLVLGLLLLYILEDLKFFPVARRLSTGISILLFMWIIVNGQGVIFPFVVSFILAFLLDPLISRLMRWKLKRLQAVLLLSFLVLGLFVFFGFILIPNLLDDIQQLIARMPSLLDTLFSYIERYMAKLISILDTESFRLKESITTQITSRIEVILSNIMKALMSIGVLFGYFLNVILVPVLTFYFLKDFDKLRAWFMEFFPRKKRNLTAFYLWRMNRILGGFFRGQIIVCFYVGILTTLGFMLFRLPFAVFIGIVTGLLNIIPFIGLYVSLGLAILVCLFAPHSGILILKVLAVFALVQGLENYVISPKVVGDRLGLHPIAVIFSILIFSKFFGIWGLLIGVPCAALIKFFIDEWKRHLKWHELREAKHRAQDP
ncbi:AI-2E family transporter [bacterium]|nr:AI-2E family transporter [bacterium]